VTTKKEVYTLTHEGGQWRGAAPTNAQISASTLEPEPSEFHFFASEVELN